MDTQPPPTEPFGISQARAIERAARLADVSATLTLDIPSDRTRPVRGTVVYRFHLTGADAPLVFDFAPDRGDAPDVTVDGRPCDVWSTNGHLVISASALRPGTNVVAITFVAGTGGLHRATDLVYSLFVPARASSVFPCVDQPDIRVRWTVVLDIPREWAAVSNGRQTSRTRLGTADRVTFGETAPLPTYLLALAVGRFTIDAATDDGRPMRVFHRETDADRCAASLPTIVDRHRRALAWLETWTGIAHPFDSFDVVLIPSFQFGGMEHPGAVYYRADLLVLDDNATPAQRLARDHVIAHETAHLWFGDLVTLRWFDDVWIKEVLANVMAAKIVAEWHPDESHDLRFLLQHYPAAYAVDRTAGANAIRQPLDNLTDAGGLYGPIIYLKAPIAFRDLERQMGSEAFQTAMRAFLTRHAFGSAAWPDLRACIAGHTSLDLAGWSRAWIETPGRPRIMVPASPATSDPAAALPDDGLAYGEIVLPPSLQEALEAATPTIADPVRRAAAHLVLWDAMLDFRLAPARLLAVVLRTLAAETQPLTRQLLLDQVRQLFWRFTRADARGAEAATVERVLAGGLATAVDAGDKAAWLSASMTTALSDAAVDWLYDVWRGTRAIDGLVVSADEQTLLALELAVRRPVLADEILQSQRARLADPERAQRLAFLAPAVSADAAVRERFAAGLADPARRRPEPWVLDAVRLLHHPLRADESAPWVVPALSLMRDIQRTGDIFFPQRWVDATLAGHQSPSVAAAVLDFVDGLPANYPHRLRNTLLVAADPLVRAARWVR